MRPIPTIILAALAAASLLGCRDKAKRKDAPEAGIAAQTEAPAAGPAAPVPRISSSDSPEMYDRYPGTNGSTQGEMNDRSPAPKAASSVTFSSMSSSEHRRPRRYSTCLSGMYVPCSGTPSIWTLWPFTGGRS